MRTTPAALHIPELADEPGFVHGFSTLAVGSVGLKHASDPAPVLRARSEEARARATEKLRELAALSAQLHQALLEARLRDLLGP